MSTDEKKGIAVNPMLAYNMIAQARAVTTSSTEIAICLAAAFQALALLCGTTEHVMVETMQAAEPVALAVLDILKRAGGRVTAPEEMQRKPERGAVIVRKKRPSLH